MKKLSTFAIILLVVLGCEREIPFTGSTGKSQIVINGINEVGKPIEVELFRSVPITLNYYGTALELNDANVVLTVSDGQSEVIQGNDNKYTSTIQPEEGKTYTLEVTHPDFEGAAIGEYKVPLSPEFAYADLYQFQSNNGEGYRKVKFQIKNPRGVRNYYTLQFIALTEAGAAYQLDFSSFDPKLQYSNFEEENGRKYFYGEALISDVGFENVDMEFDVDVFSPLTALDSIYMVVSSIPSDLYLYRLSVREQEATSWDPFSEPGIVSNEIQNGIGLFTVKSPATKAWVID
jgi:hypothetical protein